MFLTEFYCSRSNLVNWNQNKKYQNTIEHIMPQFFQNKISISNHQGYLLNCNYKVKIKLKAIYNVENQIKRYRSIELLPKMILPIVSVELGKRLYNMSTGLITNEKHRIITLPRQHIYFYTNGLKLYNFISLNEHVNNFSI